MNLWNPSGQLSIGSILVTALLLGLIHGVTPDEHTWPITFSYSIGSYSTRGGMRAGFLFSLAFTAQRAIASEIAWFVVGKMLVLMKYDYVVYIVVGLVMATSGAYILRLGRHIHWFGFVERFLARKFGEPEDADDLPRRSPARMALVHGAIAGMGTGAFAVILYTVLSPQMPSAWVGFVPGLLFGIGTMIMQVILGALVGYGFGRLRLDPAIIPVVARRVSGSVLFYGGLVFTLVGILEPLTPIGSWHINTSIRVHNLDTIDVGFFLSVVVLFVVAIISFWKAIVDVKRESRGHVATAKASRWAVK